METEVMRAPTKRRRTRLMIVASAAVVAVVTAVVLTGIALVWYADRTQNCYQFNHIRQYGQCVAGQFSSTGGLMSRLGHALGCLLARGCTPAGIPLPR
ncbi:hypothetical protein G4X40_01150 [Rhodococcus sp. D2-41]|uniref:Uncharacterized protein n=1 Tax=Speluncibacter jeojiensis TaxID=2710754 RepID=A0A9X4RC01_9ACTN|nr:hypothetical protein [Rhodococcus sp. D2-41]MDG3008749.1 hypothetical protein [Rhodococcus sp. D2-41]MDG3013043.1 hypothetical protein [Corynebacteriales bacterium D3-21]